MSVADATSPEVANAPVASNTMANSEGGGLREKQSFTNRSWWFLALSLVLGLVFLWPTYATRMWNSGHYQFFVFVLAVVAWLLWSRKSEIAKSRSTPSNAVVLVSWLCIALFIAVGNVAYSGFAGIVATIFAIACGIYSAYGWGGLRSACKVLWLLGFAVPLPLMLDQELIIKMQVLASDLASRLLDGTGVIHFRQGVIIETPKAKFMTEEACSGIRSLFSSMAAVSIYGVTARHRLWRIVINLIQTIVWVLIGNSIRVAFVVAFADLFPSIATGLGHELLGIAVFGFILAMVASTDVALSRWISDQLVIDASSKSSSSGYRRRMRLPPSPISGFGHAVLVFALSVTVLVALRTAWVRQAKANENLYPTFASIAEPSEGDFSQQFAKYEKQSFKHVERDSGMIWAKNSFVFEFKRGHLSPILSIDRPWNEWHNLNYCYSNIGWESNPTYAISPKKISEIVKTSHHAYSELILKRSGQYGFVIFSAVDRLGQHVPEMIPSGATGLIAAMRLNPRQMLSAIGLNARDDQYDVSSARLPVSTIQVYAESPGPWKEEDLESLRDLFFALREEIAVTASRQK